MTGLDKIVLKIQDDSKAQVTQIIQKAYREAREIIAKAESDSELKKAQIIADADKEAERIISVAKSSADTVTRTKYLEVRNAVVNDIISAAYEEIEKLSDNDYFDLLFKICEKNIEPGKCIMLFNKKDLQRLPNGFESKINEAFMGKSEVEISSIPIDIDNGFVLDYIDFEINCTLKAVFDERMDKLRDLVSGLLFE